MNMRDLQKKALEICCYVCGAGAFSVFIRWLQFMQAFDEQGLVDKSFFNFLVPAMLLGSALLFVRIIDGLRRERYYIPEDFYEAFKNQGRLYTIIRWVLGLVMVAGSVMLLISSETDKNADILKLLSAAGVVTGFCLPLLLSCANKPHVANRGMVCFYSFMPILFFCVWLVACYMTNAINPVVWGYGLEIVTVIIAMLAFFRVAGFAFGVVKTWRCMFLTMLGADICIMAIADERYMGMQLMLFAAAMTQALYVWILVCNLKRGEKQPVQHPNDGFERLNDAEILNRD